MNRLVDLTGRFPLKIGPVFLFFLILTATGHAQLPPPMLQTHSVATEQKPLRDFLTEFGHQNHVPIWIDRHVDPTTAVTLSLREPAWKIVDAAAQRANAVALVTPTVIVVAKHPKANQIATVLQSLQSAATKSVASRRLLVPKPFQWERLTTPREILKELGSHWSTTVDLEGIGHDHWPAYRWENVDAVTLCVLIGSGFDLQPTIDDANVRWSPLATDLSFRRTYRSREQLEALRGQVLASDPQATWRPLRDQVELIGNAAAHHWLLTAATVKTPEAGTHRYTLKVINRPLQQVLQELAKAEGWQLQWHAASQALAQSLVSIDVTNATAESIVEQLAQSLQLSWILSENQLRLGFPKP